MKNKDFRTWKWKSNFLEDENYYGNYSFVSANVVFESDPDQFEGYGVLQS